jgi:hypothetical protein
MVRSGLGRQERGCFQEAAQLLVLKKQRLDLLAQGPVGAAGRVEIRRPFGAEVLLEGGDENVALAHGGSPRGTVAIGKCVFCGETRKKNGGGGYSGRKRRRSQERV